MNNLNNETAAEDLVNEDVNDAEGDTALLGDALDNNPSDESDEPVAATTALLAGSSMALVKLREQQAAALPDDPNDDQEDPQLSESDQRNMGGVLLHDPQMNDWLMSEKEKGGTVEFVRDPMSSSKRAAQYSKDGTNEEDNENSPSPILLNRNHGGTIPARRPTMPGAVAVENQAESSAPNPNLGHDHEQGQPQPQEPEPQQQDDNPQHHPQDVEGSGDHLLLNATLVRDDTSQDEENNANSAMLVVDAEEAPTGFKALLGNRYFIVLAIVVTILVVAVIVPLSVASSKNDGPAPAPVLPLEQRCGQRSILQADYRGSINVTETGLECQRWDQQSPHIHSWTKEDENYCRNPEQGSAQRPWCYTTDPKIRFQFCDVPYCDGGGFVDEPKIDCGSVELRQLDYRGTMNVTATGRTCQRWDSQEPHSHQNTPEIRPKAGLEGNNYCRNPSGFEPVAWCYTEDPEHPWEYCAVPVCTSDERTFVKPHNITSETFSVNECGTENLRQADYRGSINTTISGRTCQRWDTQKQLRMTEELVERAGLEENYCRNWHGSDINGAAFCYTEDADWEYCPVPFCPLETVGARKSCGSSSLLQTDYRGDISNTLFAFRCMDWSESEDAKALGLTPEKLPLAGLFGPFCRNPDNRERAWCYVAGQPGVWQYCNVPVCQECGTDYLKKTDYRGTQSVTVNNRTCIPWVDAHGGFSLVVDTYGLESNYCRNPVGREDDVFCLVENNDTSWQIELCDVPTCEG